jgi:hypothetical protein
MKSWRSGQYELTAGIYEFWEPWCEDLWMAFDHHDPRWHKHWGTPEEVRAAFLAGWDIGTGPPPHHHALPPDSTIEAVDPSGHKFFHNGIKPTGSPSVIINDTFVEPGETD